MRLPVVTQDRENVPNVHHGLTKEMSSWDIESATCLPLAADDKMRGER